MRMGKTEYINMKKALVRDYGLYRFDLYYPMIELYLDRVGTIPSHWCTKKEYISLKHQCIPALVILEKHYQKSLRPSRRRKTKFIKNYQNLSRKAKLINPDD